MNKWILLLFLIPINQGYGAGFSSLQLGGEARAGALGMAYTALSDDGSGGYWNPAGLVLLKEKDILFSVHRWIEDVRSEFLGFGICWEKTGLGIHILHTEIAGLEHRIVPSPSPISIFSNHELIIGISCGRIIRRNLSIGITLKLLYEKIFVEEVSGLAGDLGILCSVWENGLRIGGVLQNVGKTNLLKNEDITLPILVKIGLALPVQIDQNHFLFVLDGIKEKGFPFHLHGGVEYGFWDQFFLRLGYQTGYEMRHITGGIGIVWRQYRLNYSYMPFRLNFGDGHRLSIGLAF